MLGQMAVDGKSNEITAVPQLLALLSLQGTVVAADAMHCQRAVAEQVLAQGGNYVLALKGNQGTWHEDVRHLLDASPSLPTATHITLEKEHGRIETRTSVVSSEIAWLQEQHHWPGLAALGQITRTREIEQQTSTETAYYLLSTPLSAERFGQVARQHWGYREQFALGAGRDHERGASPGAQRAWPGELGFAAALGAQCRSTGTVEGVDEGQTEAGRMEQLLPHATAGPICLNMR